MKANKFIAVQNSTLEDKMKFNFSSQDLEKDKSSRSSKDDDELDFWEEYAQGYPKSES